jgi:protein SCO1/2
MSISIPWQVGRVSSRIWLTTLLLAAVAAMHAGTARASGQVWGADYFPNYELTAHTGEKLRFFDDVIAGKVVAINFIFTNCTDVCPMETARLADVYRLLGDRVGEDVHFYSITIDPENDTVAVLSKYAERFGIDGGNWKFLTGDKRQIDDIRDKFGLYGNAAEEADLSNHNINLVLGNQSTGHWVRRSPFENPYILANQLGSWLHGGKVTSAYTRQDYAQAPELRQISAGEIMFRDRCSSCHVISGGFAPARNARALGPDLFAVSQRRDPQWLRRWLAEPDKMLAEGDPIAAALYAQYEIIMPNFRLETGEIEALIDYMASETERLRRSQLAAGDHVEHQPGEGAAASGHAGH